jgi:hypothetical protein
MLAGLSSADTPTVGITDAGVLTLRTLPATDSLSVGITDATSAILAALSRTDNPTVGITDAGTLQIGKSASDSLPGFPVLRSDTFDRADANSTGTPSDGGSAWYGDTSSLRIISNRARPWDTGSTEEVYLDTGAGDMEASFTIVVMPGAPVGNIQLHVRSKPAPSGNTGLYCTIWNDGTITVNDSGSGFYNSGAGYVTAGATITVGVVGSAGYVKVNGTTVWSGTTVASATNTRISIASGSAGAADARIDDLQVLAGTAALIAEATSIAGVLAGVDTPTVAITDAAAAQRGLTAADMLPQAPLREDTFERADGAIGTPSDGGSAWTGATGAWSIAGGMAVPGDHIDGQYVFLSAGASDVIVEWVAVEPPDTGGEYKIGARADGVLGGNAGVRVGIDSARRANLYDETLTRIRLGNIGEVQEGDTVRLRLVGSTATIFVNGVQIYTTSSFSSSSNSYVVMHSGGNASDDARIGSLRVLDPSHVSLLGDSSALQASLAAADDLPGGMSPVGDLLFTDDFTRATGLVGNGWLDADGSASQWNVISNELAPWTGRALQDVGEHNVAVEAVFDGMGTLGSGVELGLVVRYNSASPYYNQGSYFVIDENTVPRLYIEGGEYVVTFDAGDVQDNDVVRLVAVDNVLEVWINGELLHRDTRLTREYGTRCGFQYGNATGNSARFDAFRAYEGVSTGGAQLIIDEVDDLDTEANLEPVAGSDTASVGITDATLTIAAVLARTDTATIVVTDATSAVAATLSRTDTASVGLTDAAAAIAAVLARSDTVSVGITDATLTVVATLSRSDTPTVGVTDVVTALAASLSRTDTVTVSVTEAVSLLGSLSRTDTLLLAFGVVENQLSNPTPTSTTDYNAGPSLTYDATAGALRSTVQGTVQSLTKIPVQRGAPITISAEIKGDPAVGNFYAGFISYDGDGSVIGHEHVAHRVGTETTLAAPLNPGDTTVTLTSAANWQNAGATHERSFGFWPGGVYTESNGLQHPAYTYTRWVYTNRYDASAISGNVITLSAPWAGAAFAAGTPVANTLSGGAYNYIAASNTPLPADWTTYSGTADRLQFTTAQPGNNELRYGTQSVAFMVLANYPPGGGNTLIRNMAVITAEGEQTDIDVLVATTDTVSAGITDAVSALLASLSASDTPTVRTIELPIDGSTSTRTVQVFLERTDAPAVGVTDVGGAISGQLAGQDELGVGALNRYLHAPDAIAFPTATEAPVDGYFGTVEWNLTYFFFRDDGPFVIQEEWDGERGSWRLGRTADAWFVDYIDDEGVLHHFVSGADPATTNTWKTLHAYVDFYEDGHIESSFWNSDWEQLGAEYGSEPGSLSSRAPNLGVRTRFDGDGRVGQSSSLWWHAADDAYDPDLGWDISNITFGDVITEGSSAPARTWTFYGVSSVAGLISTSDTPSLGITEGRTLMVTLSRSDNPTVGIDESIFLFATRSATDALTIGFTESANLGGGNFISAIDTLALVVEEATSGAVTAAASDSVTVGLTDQRLDLSVFLAALEALGVGLTEARATAVFAAVADALNLQVVDASTTAGGVMSASDVLSVGLTDAVLSLGAYLAASDAVGLQLQEARLLAISLSAADALALGVSDSSSAFVLQSSVDELAALVVDDVSGTAVVLSASDLQELELLEEALVGVQLDRSDLLVVGITDHGVVELPEAIWGAVVQVISILARVQSLGALERVSTITAVPRSETIAAQARTQGTSQVEREQDIESIEGLAVVPSDV